MCRHLRGNSNPPLPLSIEQSIRAPHSPAVCLRGRGPLSHTLAAPADASGHRGAQEGCCASALRRGKTPRSALSLPPESSTQGLSTTPGPVAGAPCSPPPHPESPGNAAAPHSACKGIGAPRPPARLPCDAAGTHRLICAGCLVLLKEKVPGASHNAQKAEPPPCSSCLPLQMATPPHHQDQGNVATATRNPGTLSLSHPHPTGSKPPWLVARMAALCRQVGTLSSDS